MANGAAARHLQEKQGVISASAVEAVGDDPRRRPGVRASLGEQGAQRCHVVMSQLRKDTGRHGIIKRRQSHGAELTFPYLRYGKARHLLLIRLTQHTPTGSVRTCPGRRSRKPCGSSSASSRRRKPAESTWPSADGRTGLYAHVAGTGRPTNWARYGSGSVPVVDTKLQ
jgi:hypothetical protein